MMIQFDSRKYNLNRGVEDLIASHCTAVSPDLHGTNSSEPLCELDLEMFVKLLNPAHLPEGRFQVVDAGVAEKDVVLESRDVGHLLLRH